MEIPVCGDRISDTAGKTLEVQHRISEGSPAHAVAPGTTDNDSEFADPDKLAGTLRNPNLFL